MSLLNRLFSAWRRHGAAGFLRLIGKNVSYYTGELVSGRIFRKHGEDNSEFDQAYGTDTENIREVGSLDIKSDNARYAVRYQPSPHDLAHKIIHGLAIHHDQYTFLDFGAGKGRVLLIAAELPFQAVIGIEFSSELCAIANNNIAKIAPEMRAASKVECQLADATAFPLPETPLVCYFYNPFSAVIMKEVMDRLIASLKHKPRDIYVIYVHPEHRAIFDNAGYWDIVGEAEFHIVYRSRPHELETAP